MRIGEATTKDITDPKGTLALNKPTVMGIVEQAQKGVKAPIMAPSILPSAPLCDNQRCLGQSKHPTFAAGLTLFSSH